MIKNKLTQITIGLVYVSLVSSAYADTIDSLERQSRALASKTKTEAQSASFRWNHAKELLGKYYKKSVVQTGESVTELDNFILDWTQRELKKSWKKYSYMISKTISEQSEKYGFDPVFLMAVIENESSFNPEIVGKFGEIGLMQITPDTAKWIAKKYNLPWTGKNSLRNPIVNIQIGSAYLAYLREKFSFHSQLYLAAYNMGSTNVHRALERQVWPKEYPMRVMHRYIRFYSELKEEINKNVD